MLRPGAFSRTQQDSDHELATLPAYADSVVSFDRQSQRNQPLADRLGDDVAGAAVHPLQCCLFLARKIVPAYRASKRRRRFLAPLRPTIDSRFPPHTLSPPCRVAFSWPVRGRASREMSFHWRLTGRTWRREVRCLRAAAPEERSLRAGGVTFSRAMFDLPEARIRERICRVAIVR